MIRIQGLDQRQRHAGQYVRNMREACGLTVDQVAEGVARTSTSARLHLHVLQMVEEGRYLPSPEYLARLATVLPMDAEHYQALATPHAQTARFY